MLVWAGVGSAAGVGGARVWGVCWCGVGPPFFRSRFRISFFQLSYSRIADINVRDGVSKQGLPRTGSGRSSGIRFLSLTATRGGGVVGGIQYISDENQKITGVIVPIDLWREVQAEQETA